MTVLSNKNQIRNIGNTIKSILNKMVNLVNDYYLMNKNVIKNYLKIGREVRRWHRNGRNLINLHMQRIILAMYIGQQVIIYHTRIKNGIKD